MAKFSLAKNLTSKIVQVFIQDSSSTTCAGLTGLLFSSGSLAAYYQRENAASPVAITLVTMTVGTWASGGFKEVSSANMPGVYQLGLPDAAIADGADSVVVMLRGAANMAPVTLELDLKGAALQTPVKRNTALNNFTFLMIDTTGQPKTGLTVLAQRSLDGAPFANAANTPAEIGFGVYKVNLAAGDLNAVDVCLRFTATGARDSIITILTIP